MVCQALAKRTLVDLAGRVARVLAHELEALGDLLTHQSSSIEESGDRRERRRIGCTSRNDDRAAPLSDVRVGHAYHGNVGNSGVGVEAILDLLGADVLAFADDDVL